MMTAFLSRKWNKWTLNRLIKKLTPQAGLTAQQKMAEAFGTHSG